MRPGTWREISKRFVLLASGLFYGLGGRFQKGLCCGMFRSCLGMAKTLLRFTRSRKGFQKMLRVWVCVNISTLPKQKLGNTVLIFEALLFWGVLPFGGQEENHSVFQGYAKESFLMAQVWQSKKWTTLLLVGKALLFWGVLPSVGNNEKDRVFQGYSIARKISWQAKHEIRNIYRSIWGARILGCHSPWEPRRKT